MTRLLLLAALLAAALPARPPGGREFHARAAERSGVLVPLYVYPGDVDRNPHFTRLLDLRRRFETVPMWVIVNPASGPGKAADRNYARAIDRLVGAGCVTLGYVSTSYAKRDAAAVRKDVDRWRELYPRVHGTFFDEMIYEDTDAGAKHQAGLTRHAHDAGRWPVVANPGADTPPRYFAADAADVIVVHEGAAWPKEGRLKERYADHPPFTRAVLVHSRPAFDAEALRDARKHARWFYVTEGEFRPGDPEAANPWDRLSKHLEALCEQLAGR
ncbi:MAG: spherulation-specific family 4 protein [Gemmataceae bacterium]